MRADLLIVGGGPAGLATAIRAAELGLSVRVIERGALPLDKACGEGLMPPGVEALATLGAEIAPARRHPFVGIRFVQGDTVAEGRFLGAPGHGLRRTVLIEALVARARAVGVSLAFGSTLRSFREDKGGVTAVLGDGAEVQAKTLVGADGLHSRVRAQAGLGKPSNARRRYGIRRHYALPPWSPFVEVHWADRAEAYVTPVDADTIGVAILWPGGGGGFAEQLQAIPALAERLAGAPAITEAAGAGPFWQAVRARTRGRIALVGDAAGYADALTGEGVSLAMVTGIRLAELIHQGQPLRRYERDYAALTASYYRTTRLFLGATRTPWLRRRVIRHLAARPETFQRFLAINMGAMPLYALGLANTLDLALGVLGPAVSAPGQRSG